MFLQITEFFRKRVLLRLRLTSWRHGRYTRVLEDEVARLRAENRALVNSILGIAGIPPALDLRGWRLEVGKEANADSLHGGQASSSRRMRATPRDDSDGEDRKNAGVSLAGAHATAPCIEPALRSVRRRSWRQIGRALEMEDARAAQRERESDTEAFPSPRNIVIRAQSFRENS